MPPQRDMVSDTSMRKPPPTPNWQRQRQPPRLSRGLGPAACLLSLLLLYGCAPEWVWAEDTTTIACTGNKTPAIFSYSVAAQGIQFPGMNTMLKRDIPTWVQYLWVEENRFLVIYSSRKLHCDNLAAMKRNPSTVGCEGHRAVSGHEMLKYSDGRMRHWDPAGARLFFASNIDFEPVEAPIFTATDCKKKFSYLYTLFHSIRWQLWDLARQF